MMVCAHGNVAEFCREHDMVICDTWDGDISQYRGVCSVLVTDKEMSEKEYCFLKGCLSARGFELVSTRYRDHDVLPEYSTNSPGQKFGRQSFGYMVRDGKVVEDPRKIGVVRRIRELAARGMTLREIREDPEVCHPDGRKISISKISEIIKDGMKE